MNASVRVLLGDSSPSELPPSILDTLVEVCLFARDVTIAHEQTVELWRQLDAAEHSFAEISEQLQRFRRVGEAALLEAVKDAGRAEMKEHGQQAAGALGLQIECWLSQYKGTRDKQVESFRQQIDALHEQMGASLDRFALPLRGQPTQRVIRRKLEEGKKYLDVATLEILPGLRAELELEDTETEQPRRLKTLLGKGRTLQVGTKKSLLRRTEEPAHISLDDLVIVAAQIGPDEVRLQLAKKAAGPVTLRVGLGLVEGAIVGRGELPDGSGNALPEEDAKTLEALWTALQGEAKRIIASPARSLSYALRDEPVETPAGFVNVAERILQEYRPIIAEILAHSPNDEELTVKVEQDERREEKWIRRRTLADHLSKVPETFASRLSVPEVLLPTKRESTPAPATNGVARTSVADESVSDDDLEDKATRAYAAVQAELLPDNTEDISLTDLEIAGEIVDDVPPPLPRPAELPAELPPPGLPPIPSPDGPRPKS